MNVALVTGSSYGIGKAITDTLLKEGWKVYGLSRSKPPFKDEHFVWVNCDLSDQDAISKAIPHIQEPQLDAFISNAGVIEVEDASKVTDKSFQATFSVNVLAPMLLVRHLRKKLETATIISISSVADRLPEPAIALYCSSKAANTSYFNALAQEFKQAKVFTILPDYVETPMLHSTMDDDKSFDWSCTIKPEDIAQLSMRLIDGQVAVDSGSNIIVVTEALKEDLKSVEKLYGYVTDSNELIRL